MNIEELIKKAQSRIGEADIAERYYDGEHDILKNRIVYINDEGNVVEDKYSSNIRIPTPFFRELVQQSTTNILFEDVKFNTEHADLNEYLKMYITTDTHEVIAETLEESSKKGWQWVYVYRDDEGLPAFQTVDGRQVIAIEDEYGNMVGVLRFYDKKVEVWDSEFKYYMEKRDDGKYVEVNKEVHTVRDDNGSIVQGFGVPWYELKNNRNRESDLKGIKPFIDDYDIMSSYSSNDLQDFRGNVYVLKGAMGEDLKRLKHNVSSLGAVSMDSNQDLKVEHNTISVDSRLKKMEIDRQNIFSVGQGFDTTTTFHSNGTVTNVQLKLGQQKLIQKCSGKIKYLNGLLRWMLDIILDDIRIKLGESYPNTDVEIEYTNNLLDDAIDSATTEKVKEDARLTKLRALKEASYWLSNDTIVELVAQTFDLDPEEEIKKLNMQGYEGVATEYVEDLIDDLDTDTEVI